MVDLKLPDEMVELTHELVRMNAETIEIVLNLHVIFNDETKVLAWLTTKNPHFGNIAPLRLMQMGRGHKVLKFIEVAQYDNE